MTVICSSSSLTAFSRSSNDCRLPLFGLLEWLIFCKRKLKKTIKVTIFVYLNSFYNFLLNIFLLFSYNMK